MLACDKLPEEPVCEVCNDEAGERFSNRYFRVVPGWDAQPVLAEYDSASGESTAFRFCPGALQEEAGATLQFTQLVKASGSYKRSCEDETEQLIDLTAYEIIYTCPPPIPQLSGEFSIFRFWQVQWLQTPDTLLYPPCEGPSFLEFFNDDEPYFHGSTGQNGITGLFSLHDGQVLQIADYVQTLVVGTDQQVAFELLFMTIFERNASFSYAIEDNFLTLTNSENQSSVRLFTTGE